MENNLTVSARHFNEPGQKRDRKSMKSIPPKLINCTLIKMKTQKPKRTHIKSHSKTWYLAFEQKLLTICSKKLCQDAGNWCILTAREISQILFALIYTF